MLMCSICLCTATETFNGESRCKEHGSVISPFDSEPFHGDAWEEFVGFPCPLWDAEHCEQVSDLRFWTILAVDARKWDPHTLVSVIYDGLPPVGFSWSALYHAVDSMEEKA